MKYSVDIGETYEYGRVVIVQATDARSAFNQAIRLCHGVEEIQQIFKGVRGEKNFSGRCLYDYLNGFYGE